MPRKDSLSPEAWKRSLRSKKADPELTYFVDCLRGALRLEPLYSKRQLSEAERFAARIYPER